MLHQPLPAITVGMMVHNEGLYVERSINSLLQQDERNFELLVLDNASTDSTADVCQRLAAGDGRIRYQRQPVNRGAIHSFGQLIDQARGDYFVLASGHDLWSPNYLNTLKRCLDNDDVAVLAFGNTRWIDACGDPLPVQSGLLDTSGMHEVGRFLMVLWNNRNCLYGMHRLDALRRTDFRMKSIAMESVIMQQLSLAGSFVLGPEATWYRRTIRSGETAPQRLDRYYRAGFLFDRSVWPLLPYWNIPPALMATAWRAGADWQTRLALALCSLTSLVFLRDELWSDVQWFPRRLCAAARRALSPSVGQRSSRLAPPVSRSIDGPRPIAASEKSSMIQGSTAPP